MISRSAPDANAHLGSTEAKADAADMRAHAVAAADADTETA